jgi:glycosyltransferase involved in cell wall biosynthesis
MLKYIRRLIYKIFRPRVIWGYRKHCTGNTVNKALLYYKTDAFVFGQLAKKYGHTNFWESLQIARILNLHGFSVDIVDRTANIDTLNLKNDYGLFIGIGAGDSGQNYVSISQRVPSAIRVLYALGPEPSLSNKLTEERYSYFKERHPGTRIVKRRIVNKIDMNESIKHTDAIITTGNEFVVSSYEKFGKKVYSINLSTHPILNFDVSELAGRSQNCFLYFGGNGNIVKGLDLVIEVFSQLPELQLFICAPEDETEFNAVYDTIIKNSRNIHFLGFIDVGGRVFNRVTSLCGYVILPSCSEAAATSVTTCMRRGLIPVVTRQVGLNIGNFGHLLESIEVEKLKKQIITISTESKDIFIKRILDTYTESFMYTQDGFISTFERALADVLNENINKYEKQNNI